MKIKITQLGILKNAEIELNDFTLFCGVNNTGKTYAMYTIYGLLDFKFEVNFPFVREIIKGLREEGIYRVKLDDLIEKHFEEIVRSIEDNFYQRLPRLFSTEQNTFEKTKIELFFDKRKSLNSAIEKQQVQRIHLGKEEELVFEISKLEKEDNIHITLIDSKLPIGIIAEEISKFVLKLIFSNNLKNAFLLPAERSGLNLFYKELNSRRTALLHHLQKDVFNPAELFKDIVISRYPEPIADYINFLNSKEELKKNKGTFHDMVLFLQKNLIKGNYSIDKEGDIHFKPYKSTEKLNLHLSSSTVKNLFGLWFYLEYVAEKGDCLMIDEPELNLHPDNQRQVARLLAQLVNAGLKVIVSTHSDYFVRELNNLIMLKKDFTGTKELQEKYGYQDNELLDGKKVSAYLFDEKKVTEIILDEEEGIIAETFDDVINKLNEASDDIYYTMKSDSIHE
jgi:predicted ATPase